MPPVKPYRAIPIRECNEAMVPIPKGIFVLADPHPYLAAKAPYGEISPWMLRQSILASLVKAQERLEALCPKWKIKLYDAYRPNAVQAFMVDREFEIQAKQTGLDPHKDRQALEEKVYRLWGIPSEDPSTPPPHSTGAAFDCTLVNENGEEVDMGSPFDENTPHSFPDAFENDPAKAVAHANRRFLNELLSAEGFVRNPSEWWHFSRGDQLAEWAQGTQGLAIYGRAPIQEKQTSHQ